MTPEAELQSVLDLYLASYKANDAGRCASVYAEDGVILSPYGLPAVGRDSIRAEHEAWFQEDETDKTMTVLSASINGDVGFCLLAYSADVQTKDGVTRVYGSSLNSLRKDTTGAWRLCHTSLNDLDHDLTQDLK